MNRVAILVAAVASLGLAVASFVLGQRLILPLPVVTARGAEVPWYITWGMVWVTVVCAFALGWFLLSSLRSPGRR